MNILKVLFLILLSGCATSYHSATFGKGYSEITTAPDSFIVTFKGNGFTSSEKVLQYALTRASELTIQNGYKYFIPLSSVDQTRSSNYSNTHSSAHATANCYSYSNFANASATGSGSSYTTSGCIVKPGLSIAIKCFKEKPDSLGEIDAEYFLSKNKK